MGFVMNVEQRHALQNSIISWKKRVTKAYRGEKIVGSPNHCACCLYAGITQGVLENSAPLGEDWIFRVNCLKNCPIGEYTKQKGCRGTPYDLAVTVTNMEGNPVPEILQWEVDWLQALLDEEKPTIYNFNHFSNEAI